MYRVGESEHDYPRNLDKMKQWRYLIRVLSSSEHTMSHEELIKQIKKTGTDRYDTKRKQMFDHFYSKHDVHFFADRTDQDDYTEKLREVVRLFPKRTLGDRKRAITPDIAIIYDASKCEMIMNVYDEHQTSDCFQFKGNPAEALVKVIDIKKELHDYSGHLRTL